MIKRSLLVLLGLILLAQFIQPDKSVPAIDPTTDLLEMTAASPAIRAMVVGACYDCHSYQTMYPWYGSVTPVNFIMLGHINEGREVLNFSVWDQFAGSEAAGENGETIAEGEMPPGYYTRMHDHGRLTKSQKQELIAWFDQMAGDGQGNGSHAHEEEDEDQGG